MGGEAKGLLVAPGGLSIVERWRRLLEDAGLHVVLVGKRPEYAGLGLPTLEDVQPDSGPLGGLVALLAAAAPRTSPPRPLSLKGEGEQDEKPAASASRALFSPLPLGRGVGGEVLAVACDMPHVSPALLHRLLTESPDASILAPRIEGIWQPLFARYDAARVLPIARKRLAEGRLALQGVLDEAGATALSTSPNEEAELTDWDGPQDVTELIRREPRGPSR
jgi:molybdopterin-guanine dinucleotide biosynthesis protein A